MRTTIPILCFSLLALAFALGRSLRTEAEPSPSDRLELSESMEPLAFMVGEWEGTATQRLGARGPSTARTYEKVVPKLGGNVLLVEGLGETINENGDKHIVHAALGVIHYDQQSQRHRIRAYKADGLIDADLHVGENMVAWGFEVPGGMTVKNTLRLTPDGKWNEIVEVSRDGKSWRTTLETFLERKKR